MNLLTTTLDPRWSKLAEIFCNSTKMTKGDKVLIRAIDMEAIPLMSAIYQKALEREVISVAYQLVIPELDRKLMDCATIEQLSHQPSWMMKQIKEMDVYIALRARANINSMKGVPLERIVMYDKALRSITDYRCAKTRWCITYVPTNTEAMLAGMSTPEYVDYFFDACCQDYAAMAKNNQALVKLMKMTDKVFIQGRDVDLDFSIKGIDVESCHGSHNIPDGEVFTAPVKKSVRGKITYNIPSIYNGSEWTRVEFTFRDGKIVEASCDQGAEAIKKIIYSDKGSCYIGEFAIGTNLGIRRPAKNTLFDEKMFGSFHFTPGSAYKTADNGNKSNQHWDLIYSLTPEHGGGRILFDGAPIMENGLFVHPDLLPMNHK